MATSDHPPSKTTKDWSLWRTLVCFFAGVLAVHALIIAFHLMMLAQWPVGRLLRHFYYSHSALGAKETWPLIDYYFPTMLLLAITVNFLKYRSILIYLAGWIFCCITIVGPMPIYSTQWVPTPVPTWGTPHPPPFAPLPQNSPFLLVMSFALVLLKFLAKFEDEEPQQGES